MVGYSSPWFHTAQEVLRHYHGTVFGDGEQSEEEKPYFCSLQLRCRSSCASFLMCTCWLDIKGFILQECILRFAGEKAACTHFTCGSESR